MEHKASPSFIKSIEGRTVTGLFAIHGNIDDYGDVSMPGSFTKTINERVGSGKVRFLWSHTVGDYWMGVAPEPPIAVVKSMREVGRDELPPAVFAKAPTATGGVEVVREYLETPRGDEVLKGLVAGALNEMSYGYDPVVYDFGEQGGEQVRFLRENRLWEVSDVLWGANEATVGSKWKPPTHILLKQLQELMAGLKSGARHSSADLEMINAVHDIAYQLGASNCKGLLDSVAADGEGDAVDEEGKSRAGASDKKEAQPPTLPELKKLAYLDFLSRN